MTKYELKVSGDQVGFFDVYVEQVLHSEEYKAYVTAGRNHYFEHVPSELDIKGVLVCHIRENYHQQCRPEEITIVSPVQKEEKMLFKTNENEQMARSLINVLDISNRTNLLCGHGHDQVYGPAYDALKNLMNCLFGKDVTELAMNSSTWGPHDFDGQIIPAIEWAIEEVAQEKKTKRADKMVEVIRQHHHTAFYNDGDYIEAISGTPDTWDENEIEKIPLSWDEVYKWLGY